MSKRYQSTVVFDKSIYIHSWASVVGKKEQEGPLANSFDEFCDDEMFGQDSFEKAESYLQQLAVKTAIRKGGLYAEDIDIIFGGDLLNQCVGSNYGLRELNIPFSGVYGACSTTALSLALAACMIEGGIANRSAAVTSSHFCSAERQFRFPLEYGNQRPQSAQWTVTGAGCVTLADYSNGPKVRAVTFGRITDYGVNDLNNMGAAMAPAAADTIERYLRDTGASPDDFDLILTGDLGYIGSELLITLMSEKGIDISGVHNDCGMMIFDRSSQDTHAGGSGCGCSAAVLCGKVLPELAKGTLNNILFCATGALMSPTTALQGESIPGIAHLINISK